MKRIDIYKRAEELGKYLLVNKSTIRKTATDFGISKSVAHNDLKQRLPQQNSELSKEVNKLLEINFEEKHIRGGEATKRKHLKK